MNSETISKIIPALLKAQAQFKPAVKDAVNPAFARGQNPKPSYVTLAQAIDSVGEALRANGIVVVQQTTVEDARTLLHTRFYHESGEYIGSIYPVHPVKADPQGEGSALTYARRYALMALAGIAPEDDDGNAATSATNKRINEEQSAILNDWLVSTGSDIGKFCSTFKVSKVDELLASDYDKALAALKKKAERAAA